ncbi:MAG: cytochrome c3 family protein [Thermodesulfovibrionales bacterium]
MKTAGLILTLIILTTAYAFAEKHPCSSCHRSAPHSAAAGTLLKAPLSGLCLECHPDRMGTAEHKIDVVPAMKSGELPLGKDGKMTCITCHDPHEKSGNPKLLRILPSDLCLTCHPK